MSALSNLIIQSVKDKAVQISATGSYNAIENGYGQCSALVIELAIEAWQHNPSQSLLSFFRSLAKELKGENQEIQDQINALQEKLDELRERLN